MIKLFFSTILVLLVTHTAHTQLTWANDAAEIVFENCTACHNDYGIAPFSLMDYESVVANAGSIEEAVTDDYMPPWTADDTYQSYAHSRKLSPMEKSVLLEWLGDGMDQGNVADAPPPPVYTNEGYIQATPDLEMTMEPYTSTATFTQDDYICISLPTNLTEDKKLKAYEVIPGNPSILHHCLVYVDPSGTYPTDFSGTCVGPNNDEGLIGGYTPGAVPTVFPSNGDDINMGITIPAGSNLVLAMHYPHGSAGEVDQTSIRLFFYEDDVEMREVETYPILSNWTFNIEANTEETVSAQHGPIFQDMSLLSVFPHMHLIGEYINSYAVTLDSDVIPLVKIPHWDFEWQEFYFFESIQHIPAGSTFLANGTYNNTSTNPHNPYDPPQDIGAGLNTSDEMFLVYFHYLDYEEGDENMNLTELTSLPTSLTEIEVSESEFINVFPNPSSKSVTFSFDLNSAADGSLYVYDGMGKLVSKLVDRESIASGNSKRTLDVSTLSPGIYYFSLRLDGKLEAGKFRVE
ncbi:MAG: T9SS type A sorting domain-containing protein [Flavobacteriales bacterium]